MKTTVKTPVTILTSIALMSALMCLLGPLSIPVGPVPISLTNFVIFLTIYLLGMKYATISYGIYFLLGLAGLPVFSGYTGGLAKIAGPTGGYLIGFFFLTIITGIFTDRYARRKAVCIAGMILASAVMYAFGTLWLKMEAGLSWGAAFAAGVLPFIAVDLAKIILVSFLGPALYSRLASAGFRYHT